MNSGNGVPPIPVTSTVGASQGPALRSLPSGSTKPDGPRAVGGNRKYFRRKKVCRFSVEKIDSISYRDVQLLRGFISERGKILPPRLTGTSPHFQRKLTSAIKRARNIALLPFAARP